MHPQKNYQQTKIRYTNLQQGQVNLRKSALWHKNIYEQFNAKIVKNTSKPERIQHTNIFIAQRKFYNSIIFLNLEDWPIVHKLTKVKNFDQFKSM